MTEAPRPIGVPSGESNFPVLPLRDIVVFPHMIVPLFVGREKSINALEEVMRADKQILLATQKDAGDDEPTPRGNLRGRHARDRAAAPEASRRHREGAGRGARPRADPSLHRAPGLFRGRGAHARRDASASRSRSRRWPARSCPSSRTT